MKKNLLISVLMTIVTTALLGLIYPLAMTGIAQALFPKQANGSLIERDGKVVGSQLIGQQFSGPGYFHPRPSAAGAGYDAANSGGTNLAPTNHVLIERVKQQSSTVQVQNRTQLVPIDLVTTSASGLDPHITPAAADFQIARVARERGMNEGDVSALVVRHTESRQWTFLGEPRVNVLELNLDLDTTGHQRIAANR